MNLPTVQAQLPAHLAVLAQNTSLMALNQSAAAGIGFGGWPRISLKAARFRLQQPQGEEFVVPQLHLDVIIVDANPHGISKRYWEYKWDSSKEGAAPDCYSDNGVGPSIKSMKPQCGTCAACPHNAWGSKISEISGKPIKACSDLKKVAVLIAENTAGPVFELDIPADSMSVFAQYVKALDKHGVPMSTIITRLTFDPNVSYPKLMFAPAFSAEGQLPYISAEQAQDVMDVINTEEVEQCIGKNDKAVDPSRVVAAATTVIASQTPVAPQAPISPITQAAPAMPVTNAALQGSFPLPAAPTGTPVVAAPAGAPSAPTATKRTRKAKITPDAAPAEPVPQQAAEPIPAFIRNMPPVPTPLQQFNNSVQAADATAPLAPAGVTNAALDDLIAQAMKI